MRTYTRSDLDAANRAWEEGHFSAEWKDTRHFAAMGGLIFPPEGDRFDSWEDDSPSQRAMLIRAIRETPALLRSCLFGAPSWGVVLDRLLRGRDEWRERTREDEQARSWESREIPGPKEDAMALGRIVERLAASVGAGMIESGRGPTGVSNGGIRFGSGSSTVLIPGDLAQPRPRPLPPSESE